jgi:hypothetical protein
MAIKVKTLRTNLHLWFPFKRPVLDFNNIPGRFFSMIFDCLAGKIQVSTTDFSVRGGNALSELHSKYNVYGGISSVTMYSDRLAFDFPNLAPNDLPVVRQIIEAVHNAFPDVFSELDYDRVELNSHEHLERLIPLTPGLRNMVTCGAPWHKNK